MPSGAGDFIRQNLFSMINLATLVVGLAYFSGQLQDSVDRQNATISRMRNQMLAIQHVIVRTEENTLDISRLRSQGSAVSGQLQRVSDQIASLSQWVRDHGAGGRLAGE